MYDGSPRMDRIDRRILIELQKDATLPIAQLADRVGLSQTPCWKRVRKLEDAGVITGRVALVDPSKVGFSLTVFVEIVALDHTAEWREQFFAAVESIPSVMDVFRLSGETDYLLRITCSDIAYYDRVYQTLTESLPMKAVRSKLVMEQVFSRRALPLPIG